MFTSSLNSAANIAKYKILYNVQMIQEDIMTYKYGRNEDIMTYTWVAGEHYDSHTYTCLI